MLGSNVQERSLDSLVNDRTPLLSSETPRKTCAEIWGFLPMLPSLFAVIVTSSGEQVLRKVITTNLYHYRWFFVQIICMGTFLITFFLCLGRHFVLRQPLNLRTTNIKMVVSLAVLDLLTSILLILPSGVVPFSLALILPQLVVPVTIALQHFQTLSIPSWVFAIGTALVIGAPALAVAPCWGTYVPCPADGICGRDFSEIVVNAILLACAALPASASLLYRQRVFAVTVVDETVVTMLVSLVQLVGGFCVGPLALLMQYAGPATSITNNSPYIPDMQDFNSTSVIGVWLEKPMLHYNVAMFTNFLNGWHCLLGRNSAEEDGSLCEQYGTYTALEILLFSACGFFLRLALSQALKRSSSDVAISIALTSSMLLAFSVFLSPWAGGLLPDYLGVVCSSPTWPLAAAGALFIGLLLCQHGVYTNWGQVDIWMALEHAEAETELHGMNSGSFASQR